MKNSKLKIDPRIDPYSVALNKRSITEKTFDKLNKFECLNKFFNLAIAGLEVISALIFLVCVVIAMPFMLPIVFLGFISEKMRNGESEKK